MEDILRKDGISFELLKALSYQSALGIRLKRNLHYFDRQALFNELEQVNEWYNLLGFRSLCDNYEDVLQMTKYPKIRVADMSDGKSKDDGYRGVHIYFQLSNYHYPIEIQYNTYYDRQLNNWLHKYVYKRKYKDQIGFYLRQEYEHGNIKNENKFKEALWHVLSDSEEIQ